MDTCILNIAWEGGRERESNNRKIIENTIIEKNELKKN